MEGDQTNPVKKSGVVVKKLKKNEALHFSGKLRDARATALADSEGWQLLISVFERLAKFATSCQRTTIGKPEAADAFFQIIGGNREYDLAANSHVKLLLQQVVDGRNSEFHGGAAARRFARHCVEFSFILRQEGMTGAGGEEGSTSERNPPGRWAIGTKFFSATGCVWLGISPGGVSLH